MIGSQFGKYKIEEQLGQGGMGIVYRAYDEKLDRPVALKFLPPHLQSDAISKQRFMQEARAASALDDPHICTVHDIGEADGRLYIVMTFYDGQTLKYVLQEGPVGVERAATIAYQIAQGLSAAHEHGIIHRDIKPANVMVTNRGVVKILDFGLAKLGESSDITKAGSTLGTAAYMSPEQARGGDVDHRADIWSLGVLLYEMLTGDVPFTGGYEAAVMYSILNEEPPPVMEKRPEVPPELSDLVMRCLRKDPAARVPDADAILDALRDFVSPVEAHGIAATSSAERRTAATAVPDLAATAGKFGLLAAAILGAAYAAMVAFGLSGWVFPLAVILVLAGFPVVLYGWRLERSRAQMESGERRALTGLTGWLDTRKAFQGGFIASGTLVLIVLVTIGLRSAGVGPFSTLITSGALDREDTFVVSDFNNRTDIDGLGQTVTEAFRIDLSRSPVVSLIDRSLIRATLQQMQLPPDTIVSELVGREIAVRRGAAAIVSGDIQPAGAGFVLTARVTAADGRELVALRENASDDASILQAIDRLSSSLREEIGESLVSIRANEPLESVTTASLEALQEYSQGEAHAGAGRLREAIQHIERAIELDSTFAMAYRKLAVLHGNAGDPFVLQLRATEKAYALRRNLPERERLLTEALYYDRVLEDDERERLTYEAVLKRYPNDVTALNNLSLVYARDHRYEEAAELVKQALQTAEGFTFRINVISNLTAQGKLDETKRELDALDQALPGNAYYPAIQADLAYQEDDFSRAYAWIDSITVRDDVDYWRRNADAARRDLFLAQGRLHEYDRMHERERNRRASTSDSIGAMWRELSRIADLVELAQSPDDSRREIDRVLSSYPWETYPERARPYLFISALYTYLGDAATGRDYFRQWEQNVPEALRANNQFAGMVKSLILAREENFTEAIPMMEAAYQESGCIRCFQDIMGIIYENAGEQDKAIDAYDRFVSAPQYDAMGENSGMVGPVLERLAELYAGRGDADRAIATLTRLIRRWENADAVLQPRVRAAQERLDELLVRQAREPDAVGG